MTHPAHYLALSYQTLDRHRASGKFDKDSALRLLRRNARDMQPGATPEQQQAIATVLLQHYLNGVNTMRQITPCVIAAHHDPAQRQITPCVIAAHHDTMAIRARRAIAAIMGGNHNALSDTNRRNHGE